MTTETQCENALEEAIHQLAQPLTALTFVIGLGLLQQKPEALKDALESAAAECKRAIDALEAVRRAAAAMGATAKEYV